MPDIVYLNGKFLEREDAQISVEDRGFQFADGIYEVTRFHGRRGLRLNAHQDRLQKSGQFMKFAGVHSADEWHDIIGRLVEANELPEDPTIRHTLYQQVSRGACPRAHLFPKDPIQPTSIAYFRKAPSYPPELRETGIKLSAQPDERWNKCYIKSICLLPAIWAKQAAVDTGATEALLVRNGIVTEGASTNIFCVIDNEIHTHPEGGHILSGVTRQLVIEAAERAGIKINQRPVPLDEFLTADEAFVSSTTMDVMPVTSVDDTEISNGQVGPLTKNVMAALAELVAKDLAG